MKPDEVSKVHSRDLLEKVGLQDLDLVLRERRLRWYGHVERSNGAIKSTHDLSLEGRRGPGRPKMSWWELMAMCTSDEATHQLIKRLNTSVIFKLFFHVVAGL